MTIQVHTLHRMDIIISLLCQCTQLWAIKQIKMVSVPAAVHDCNRASDALDATATTQEVSVDFVNTAMHLYQPLPTETMEAVTPELVPTTPVPKLKFA